MRHYEIIVMIHPDKSDQVINIIDHYNHLITSDGGEIHRLENWGRRSLAYSIQNLRKAHYILMNIEVSLKVLDELKHSFKFNNSIIRSMVIRKKCAVVDVSPIMKSKDEVYSNTDTVIVRDSTRV